MIAGFERRRVAAEGETIAVSIGGAGPPVLMLHGFPQTGACWAGVAARLAGQNTCIVADLPGYGESSIPAGAPDHAAFAKRHWARLLVAAMAGLGHDRFAVLGHDRGARVAYRMALDHGARVARLAIVEIVPTAAMWRAMDADLALRAWHWPFLAQPAPLPERLIGGDPDFYLDWTLRAWTAAGTLDPFAPAALAAYRAQMRDPARLHAMCEDYRAGAGIDRALDAADRAAGRRIAAPLLFVHSPGGFAAATGDPLAAWRDWADDVTGAEVDGGHFLPEENPEGLARAVAPFLA